MIRLQPIEVSGKRMKYLVTLVNAFIAASLLTGCGESPTSTSQSTGSAGGEHSKGTTGSAEESNIKEISDATFEQEVIKSDLPVLVDFWAPWCGPCRMMGPIVEELSKENSGKLKVVKVNIDDNTKTAESYNIRSIPTLFIFKDGKLVDQIVGAVPKTSLASTISKHI